MQLDRRHLLFGGAAMMGVTAASVVAAKSNRLVRGPYGMQLWTCNDELKADMDKALKAIKRAGYDVVETAGFFDLTAKDYRKHIEKAGLKVLSIHKNMGLLSDNLDQCIRDAHDLGAKYMVCSSPKTMKPLVVEGDWPSSMQKAMTLDGYKWNADALAKVAARAKAEGLIFGYHNHHMEFLDLGDGVRGIDVMISGTSASELRLELDLGWVAAAGLDPAKTMEEYASRLDLLHVKDMVKDKSIASGYRSVEVGSGMINWRSVFKAANALGVKGFFVEQEPPFARPATQSLAISHKYLRGL